ncbi:MAG: hypothetical protein QF467_06435 [SAR202 cluster bacterium]|jgi:hypothetical protein|nr:hypothetical protein [SAR202 cluster bacterium]
MDAEVRRNTWHGEKTSKWGEWCADDSLDSVGWAVAFIWGGLVMLAEVTGFGANFSWWDGWAVFFTGAGVIVLLGTSLRLLVPEYRRKLVAGLVFGAVLLGIGLGDALAWIWPVLLIAVGAAIIRGLYTDRT